MRNERTKLFLKRNAECVVAYCVLAVVLVLVIQKISELFALIKQLFSF